MPKKRTPSRRRDPYTPTLFRPPDKPGRRKTGVTRHGGVPVYVVTDLDARVPPHVPAPHASRTKRSPATRRKDSWVGQLPATTGRAAWRHRWHLTPVVVWAATLGGAYAAPVTTAVVTLLVGAAAHLSVRHDVTFGRRKLLSAQERRLVVYWCCGATVAVAVEALPGVWSWPRATFLLTAATAYPTFRWLIARVPARRPRSRLSADAARLLKLWPRVARYSEGTLRGSTVVAGTAEEPTAGTLVFTAQLRADVHGRQGESEVVWRKVESLMGGLPPDTVRIRCHPDDSTRVVVTVAASRYLESHVVDWPGPELAPDGGIVLGDTPSGVTVVVPRYDDKGVRHARISGNTGNGKSTTARVVCTARASAVVMRQGVVQQEEVVWLVDGKRGTSVPEIRNVFDWYATTDAEWPVVLDAFYALLVDRQLRRGRANLSAWRHGEEDDPIVSLYIAESSAVRASLHERGLAKRYDRVVLELLQHGRALGMSVTQEAQDAIAPNFLGGRQARELMSKGAAIMHRPGGATGQQYAGDGAAERQRLLKLPDTEGFAAVVVNGRSLADVMRVRWASEAASAAWAAPYVPRSLVGADLAAVGEAYVRRSRGREDAAPDADEVRVAAGGEGDPPTSAAAPPTPPDAVITDVTAPARAPARVGPPDGVVTDDNDNDNDLDGGTLDWVHKMLMFNPCGLTVDELVERGGGRRGRSQASVYRCLRQLRADEKVTQDGTRYVAVREAK